MLLAFYIISWIALGVVLVLTLLVLFEPPLRYRISALTVPPDSEAFLRIIALLVDAQLHRRSSIELLSDGTAFYPAELAAIDNALHSVHIEAFIFHPGAIGDRFLRSLVNVARRGVRVRVVVDSVGSFPTPNRYFQPLRDAGGQIRWYQPLGIGTLRRLNNRTHRELIIVDGTIGFIGGAGIAAHWDVGDKGRPPWKDMVFQVRGELVAGLQTTFAENWLESSGEILAVGARRHQFSDRGPLDAKSDSVPSTAGVRPTDDSDPHAVLLAGQKRIRRTDSRGSRQERRGARYRPLRLKQSSLCTAR